METLDGSNFSHPAHIRPGVPADKLGSLLLPPFSYLYGLARLDVAGSAVGLALVGCLLILIA